MRRALRRFPFVFLLPAVVFGCVAYYAGHTGNHNGATTFGEAVSIGVFFGIAFLVVYIVSNAVFWLRELIFGREDV